MTQELGLQDAPPTIADLSAAACVHIERAVGVAVDYTPETLPIVDHYIKLARDELADRPELLTLISTTLGAYFGRVAAAHLNGFWYVPAEDANGWLVCLRGVLLAFNPVAIASDVLLLGEEREGLSAEILLARDRRDLVFSRLDALPPVGEAEYYMLATRLEALEIAASALHAAEGAPPLGELQWKDYRSLVGR